MRNQKLRLLQDSHLNNHTIQTMKIAVTAANGQLGTAIVKELKKQVGDKNIIGIVRSPERAGHLGVELRQADYSQRDTYDVALKGVDRVVLISGMDDPQKRIEQHRNVIQAAKHNGVEKIVYTSIIGNENKTAFSAVVSSNRQTEEDVKNSGLNWAIGRNSIYIEPDLEYLAAYVEQGEIRNCAGNGKCGYTSRKELGAAYAQLILNEQLNQQTYNLVGELITQTQLTQLINEEFNTRLIYKSVPPEEYEIERKAELGDFIGTVIAGIYNGIRVGVNEVPSDFEKVMGRPHKSAKEIIHAYKEMI